MDKEQQKIRIFVSYHKNTKRVENECVIPIHVGAAVSDIQLDMQRDDQGEHISDKNAMYCELTAQYWAWKNVEADYYGFMHYRRHFIFSQKSALGIEDQTIKEADYIDDNYIRDCNMKPEQIRSTISQYDVVVPLIEKVAQKNIYEHYAFYEEQHAQDYDLMLEVINDLYPDYAECAREYSSGRMGYFCNMFIMKKECFFQYSKWMFTILEEMEKRRDYSDYSVREYRVLAYLAERMLGIYILYLRKNTKLRILELQHTFVKHVEIQDSIRPAFEKNNLLIFLSADDYYTPYVSVLVYSIIKNSSAGKNYDIVILTRDITAAHKKKLQRMADGIKHVSIRFFDVTRLIEHRKFNTEAYAVETYYRLFAPNIFKLYDTGLYLDSDMVADADVAELFKENIEDYYMAVIRDYDEMGHVRKKNDDWDEYLKNFVGIKDVYSPFQGGVLLMNLKKLRADKMSEKMVAMADGKKYRIADQDVLNYCCENKVLYVDPSWDIMADNNRKNEEIFSYSPRRYYKQYLKAKEHPKIIHYCGWPKPWNDLESDLAEYFWKYARETPYYETLIKRLMRYSLEQAKKKKNHEMHRGKSGVQEITVDGLEVPIAIDGVMLKIINRFNRRFPIGSRKRNYLRAVMRKIIR